MTEEKISVIIPVYNVENYLRQCLDSVLKQTYTNLEIILINDGSTDKSGDICYEYAAKDSRICVIEQENQGISAVRNTGLDIMTGDYVYFLDSDDWLLDNAIGRLYERLKATGVDIAISYYCGFHDEDANFLFYQSDNHETLYTRDELLAEFPKQNRRDPRLVFPWCKLYKRSLFEHVTYPIGHVSEDTFTAYKLYLAAEKILYIDEPLYVYRQRKNSVSNTWDENWYRDLIMANEEQIVILGSLGYDLTDYYQYYQFVLELSKYNASVLGLQDTPIYQEIVTKMRLFKWEK